MCPHRNSWYAPLPQLYVAHIYNLSECSPRICQPDEIFQTENRREQKKRISHVLESESQIRKCFMRCEKDFKKRRRKNKYTAIEDFELSDSRTVESYEDRLFYETGIFE